MGSEILLGQYRPEKKITETRIWDVYFGTHIDTAQRVVVTVFQSGEVSPRDFLDQLESIAGSLKKFRSPHAVPLLDYGEETGQAIVVQEAVEGQLLSDVLIEGRGLSLDLVLDIAQQMGEYLGTLHQAQVVHGGLRPDAILLTHRGTIQVLNAGLAQAMGLSKLLGSGAVEPSPYHSPELQWGGALEPPVDYYALGAILFEALTGKAPELDPRDSRPGSIISGLPPELDDLVTKCLAQAPDKRIQSTAELLNGIQEVHRGIRLGSQDTMLGMEDALVGHTLGAYQLVDRLGQGGMATVYKAYEPTLDRYVAVKVLPQFFAKDHNFMARFRREARAVAQLSHPNIVPIYSFGEQGAITYIAMQYVTGGTLKQTRGQVYDTERALKLITPVTQALAYAHQQGIIHRDIKPSNVLMSEREWPLLADFGLAKMTETSTQLTGTGLGVGTPMYMSPEQGRGTNVDHRTDIYSLGIMLYEMLTGDVPFKADTPMAIVIKHITAPMPIPRQANPKIPEDLERIILKTTAKNPNDRYQTADEVAGALEMVSSLLAARRFGLAPASKLVQTSADTEARQRQTQLAALKSQVEEAIQRGDWDAATEGCNEALEIAPDDRDWKGQLAEIAASQRTEIEAAELQTKLENLKSRAEAAIQGEDWNTAIAVLQEAQALAPDDSYWSEKLEAVEASRHQAQLVALKAQAQTARTEGNWNAALSALEEYLRQEPGATDIQEEIETIKAEQRQSQLVTFKDRAQKEAEAENWDAAIDAWNDYLALEPEDQAAAKTALQKSRLYSQIASDYAAAQKLIRRRRYDQAIELLQGIRSQVPEYKVTAQLIAKAQAGREQVPFWKRPVVIGIAAAIILVGVGVVFVPPFIDQLAARATEEPIAAVASEATTTVSPTSPPEVTPTDQPTASPTEEQPLLIDFLKYIAEHTPTFEDDFSSPKSEWGTLPARISVESGVMSMNVLNGSSARIGGNHLSASDFAIQYDFMFEGDALFGIHIRDESFNFEFGKSGWWSIFAGDAYYDDGSVSSNYRPEDWNQLTIFVQAEQYIFMLNGMLLTAFNDDDAIGKNTAIRASIDPVKQGSVYIDNLKFWNLEGTELARQEGAPSFYEPVLYHIEIEAPTIDDEFPSPDYSWGNTSQGQALYRLSESGVLTLTESIYNKDDPAGGVHADAFLPGFSFPINGRLDASNFGLQFDFNTQELHEIGVRFRSTVAQDVAYEFIVFSEGSWQLVEQPGDVVISSGNSSVRPDYSTLFIVAYEENLAISLNDEWVYETEDLTLTGTSNRIIGAGEHLAQGELDNIKFWNLDGLEIGSQEENSQEIYLPEWARNFSEPILAAIKDIEPDFQDDFSGVSSGWQGDGFALTENGVRHVSEGGIITHWYFNNKRNFVLQVDLTPPPTCCMHVKIPHGDRGYSLYLSPIGWGICRSDWPDCIGYEPDSQNNRITLIVKGSEASFYRNGIPVDYLDNFSFEKSVLLVCEADSEFDNVKFWNLDGKDF